MKGWTALALLALSGCASSPKTRYDWKGYDASFYALMRDPAKLEAFGEHLKAVIDRNPDGTRIPPGIYAEYGYILFVAGRKAEAAGLFTKEKERWPESAKFMDRMIANCAPPPPQPQPQPQLPSPLPAEAAVAVKETP